MRQRKEGAGWGDGKAAWGAWGAAEGAVGAGRSLGAFWTSRTRMPRGAASTGRAGSAVVAVLAGFALKSGRAIGTRIALRTNGTRLTGRPELPVVTGGS
jgi:hypothetical protein